MTVQLKYLTNWSALLKSLCNSEKIKTELTDLVLTSAPALTTRVAMSLLPCLAAQCRAVCVEQRKKELFIKCPLQCSVLLSGVVIAVASLQVV